jgi:plastocyanin
MKAGVWIALLVFSAAFDFRALAQASGSPVRAASEAEAGPLGTVQGIVTFHGKIPKARIADDAGVRRDLLVVDRETRGLRYVVVYLTPVNTVSKRQSELPPSSPKAQVTVDQQDYAFVPRVVAVREGDPVIFTNSDPANHNVRTASAIPQNEFNVFTGTGGKYEHRFLADAKHRPIQLGCDIHPWMQAWVYVFDHSHFAVTDKQGHYRISSVPSGEYNLVLRQPDIRYTREQSVTISTQWPVKVDAEIRAESLAQPKE